MSKVNDAHLFYIFIFGDLLMIASIILWLTNAFQGSIIYTLFIAGTFISVVCMILLSIRNKKNNISNKTMTGK